MSGLGDRFPVSTRGEFHPADPVPIHGSSTTVLQLLSRGPWWWAARVQAGGRQRNAAEEIGIGRIQSPTFK